MITVGLASVGENVPVSLRSLANTLNGLQKTYRFSEIAPISHDKVGPPHFHFQWYFVEKLVPSLAKHRDRSDYDILFGVTHVRITREVTDDGDIYNRDYFSDSDVDEKVSVVTTNHNVLAFNSQSKSVVQYLVFLILGELLVQRTADKTLFHPESKLCLFDDCVDRSSLAPSIDRGFICVDCRAKLKKGNVPDGEIRDAEHVLKWCSRNTGNHSAFVKTLTNPLSSLIAGVSLGWLSQSLIPPARFTYVALTSVLAIVGVYLYYVKWRLTKRCSR